MLFLLMSKTGVQGQVHVCMLSRFSRVWLFATPWTVAHQAPLSMGILQVRILEWAARPSSRGSSQLRDQTRVSSIARRILYHWETGEAHKVKNSNQRDLNIKHRLCPLPCQKAFLISPCS